MDAFGKRPVSDLTVVQNFFRRFVPPYQCGKHAKNLVEFLNFTDLQLKLQGSKFKLGFFPSKNGGYLED